MAKWFEEVRLGNRPLEEIGAAFYIREMLGNNCLVNKWDVKCIFGERCGEILKHLKNAKILEVETVGSQMRLSIVAPGDKKRMRCRKITQTNRLVAKFERGIVRGESGLRRAEPASQTRLRRAEPASQDG